MNIISTLILFLFSCMTVFAQQSPKTTNLFKAEAGLQGIGLGYEQKLGNKWTIDFSAGAGGGYEVSEDKLVYQWNLLQPSLYITLTPKYYYNIKKRAEAGKDTEFNSANYVGLRLKYTSASSAPNDMLMDAFLINAHWGLQRNFGNKWIFNGHIGAGYAYDHDFHFGTVYPALDLKFAYILGRRK